MNLRSSRALITLTAAAIGVTALAGTAFADDHHGVPRVAGAWAAAWNGTDPAALGKVFTADAAYVDEALGVTSTGRPQIAAWKARTDQLIADVHVTILRASKDGHHVTIEAIYAGHIKGAPKPFAVPMATILDGVDDAKATGDRDYYNLAAVLSQSGLPADWTPAG